MIDVAKMNELHHKKQRVQPTLNRTSASPAVKITVRFDGQVGSCTVDLDERDDAEAKEDGPHGKVADKISFWAFGNGDGHNGKGKRRMILRAAYEVFELFAAVFHILEKVERGTAGRKEHGVAGLCQASAGGDAVGHVVGVGNGNAVGFGQRIEGFVEFGVVGSQINEGATFALHES